MELTNKEKNVLIDLYNANCKVSQISWIFQNIFDKKLSSQKIRNFIQNVVPKSSDEPELQTFLEGIEETERGQ